MTKYKKLLVCFLFVAIAFLTVFQHVEATSTNFTVHSGAEETKSISLAVDDRVLIRFTVVGQANSTLYFSITFPNGTVEDFGRIGSFYYPFVCDAEGECVLHFSNAGFPEDKLVTLNYEVDHYIFGMPQMLFLVIIIVIVCVAAVAVFIFMGKTH
jgi:hypothetical protein